MFPPRLRVGEAWGNLVNESSTELATLLLISMKKQGECEETLK